MNLIVKTTLFYLVVALLVFSIGGVVTYHMVKKEVQKETDYDLRYNFKQIVKAIEAGAPIELLIDDRVNIIPVVNILPQDTLRVYADTLASHPYLDREERQRMLTSTEEINGKFYRITAMDVFIESDDIYEGVVNVMLWLFLFLGATLFILSFLITRRLFQPFQRTLEKIRTFNLKKEASLQLPKSSTREFNMLNTFLSQMTTKARRDYVSVKEFSENASHEMQTPLAIARGKLELLMETEGLSTEQIQLIESAQLSLRKLSRLGEALGLLTKIENEEFSTLQTIDFSKIVKSCIENFEELAALQNLEFKSEIAEEVQLKIDPLLADILVANLIKNTIRHNIENGWIDVQLNSQELTLKNTGKAPTVAPAQLFERFQKSQSGNGSLGLGLAIVKKICEVNNFEVAYHFEEGVHHITVKF
ncbi:MAG: HAMP domain-containing histidine kinase [Saprospiraceae bacterium]|nr:HAMP domain-containing histidine kinase [Saprospiraceae bacterium]